MSLPIGSPYPAPRYVSCEIDGFGFVHPLRGMAKKNRYADLAASQFEVSGRTRRSNDPEFCRFLAEAKRRNDGRGFWEVHTDFLLMKLHQRKQKRLAKMNATASESFIANNT